MLLGKQPTPGNTAGCAVIPGRQADKDGWVLTGRRVNAVDPIVDVSAEGVRELMRAFGWPTPEEHRAVVEDRDGLVLESAALRRELDDLREFERAAEYTLERFGGKVRRPPGRKPKKEEEVESAV